MDNLVLETVIGLVFIFGTFAIIVSLLTEMITRFMGLRGEYLLRGIRTLVDGSGHFKLSFGDLFARTSKPPAPVEGDPPAPMTPELMKHPLICSSADKARIPANAGNAKLSGRARRRLPAYLSGRSFARALFDTVIPDATGKTKMDEIRTVLEGLPANHLRASLLALANAADQDVARFRRNIEEWYDDHMARVSGWYKRHVRWISLALGVLLVLLFNLDAVQITRSLYTDQALRASVVTEATRAAQCGDKDPATCLREVRGQIDQVRGAGLPIGWAPVPECAAPEKCGWWEQRGLVSPHSSGWSGFLSVLVVLVGWALMTLTLLPGARFWFDALSRLGSLRSTGPKPKTDT
ncbi:hypothetical protein KOI35_26550 [Actinoplanes bogorensis]|uniref:Uncharacterized protein n=1 Tax=Paractinoplanes bogorensis TaxID=1610840 RepID=A0ABS5YUM5_9ACTN|nr:hypothetical protein [Actinoplanes bogorensis]MBU2667073.1 hypothetical protein [Actinoplanes bogorensis]